MPMMMTVATSATGSTMLELEALLADASGPEADGGMPPPDPFAGAAPGDAGLAEFGTSGVTLVGTVVLGTRTLGVPATEAWDAAP